MKLHQKLAEYEELPTDISPYYKYSDLQYDPVTSAPEWMMINTFRGKFEGKKAFIKFTRQYSEDVHQLLANEGLAPKICI